MCDRGGARGGQKVEICVTLFLNDTLEKKPIVNYLELPHPLLHIFYQQWDADTESWRSSRHSPSRVVQPLGCDDSRRCSKGSKRFDLDSFWSWVSDSRATLPDDLAMQKCIWHFVWQQRHLWNIKIGFKSQNTGLRAQFRWDYAPVWSWEVEGWNLDPINFSYFFIHFLQTWPNKSSSALCWFGS